MCVRKYNYGESRNRTIEMLKLSLITLHSENGATAAEYAIMASLIAGVIVGAVTTLGWRVRELFETVSNSGVF